MLYVGPLLDVVVSARGASAEAVAAEVLRDALAAQLPRPTLPLFEDGRGDESGAEGVDGLLAEGSGEHR